MYSRFVSEVNVAPQIQALFQESVSAMILVFATSVLPAFHSHFSSSRSKLPPTQEGPTRLAQALIGKIWFLVFQPLLDEMFPLQF